jgi:hypothetical protein
MMHPFYTPINAFARSQSLPAHFSLSNQSWLVWDNLETLPARWQFQEGTGNLSILQSGSEQKAQWKFLANSFLLEIQAEATEATHWEVWLNGEPAYLQLKNVLTGQILQLLHQSYLAPEIAPLLVQHPASELLHLEKNAIQQQLDKEARTHAQIGNVGIIIWMGLSLTIFFAVRDITVVLYAFLLIVPYTALTALIAHGRVKDGRKNLPLSRQSLTILEQQTSFIRPFVWNAVKGTILFYILLVVEGLLAYWLGWLPIDLNTFKIY